MSKSKVSFILLLLCASLMPLTIYQVWTVTAVSRGGGGGNVGNGGGLPPGGGSGGGVLPPRPSQPTARPPISQPTARPTINQPTASFTRPPALTSISFTRSIATSFSFSSAWTGISFTRTVVTSYTFNPTFTTTAYYPTYGGGYNYGGGWGYIQYPPNYNTNVGSFTLSQTLIGQNGAPCAYYTYFEFNANAGQQLQARVWTPGVAINYIIVPQSILPTLQQMGCGYLQSGTFSQAHSFNSQITLNWTAPETDQYVIIFYSLTPYSGPVYFLPGAQ